MTADAAIAAALMKGRGMPEEDAVAETLRLTNRLQERKYTTGDGGLVIATPSPSRGNPGEVQFSVKIKKGNKVVDQFTCYRHAGLDYTAKQRGWKRV